jgi:alpha-amylase/alpha-mannosidase (GH57 family)
MSDNNKLDVVLYWHMHQPEYKDVRTGQYHLPWTYLHVIKDYIDMAAHLEANQHAKAVVNFTPTLLLQIDDYAQQIEGYLAHGQEIKDAMLDALVQPVHPESSEAKLTLIKHCLRANEERLIQRNPDYQRLAEHADYLEKHPDAIIYLHDQYFADLLMWFHLAWIGETVRRADLRIRKLIEKGTAFSLQDRCELLKIIGELCSNVIDRYRNLAKLGRIELSVTPFAHPILPLLLDINTTHEAMPEAELPNCRSYPGGAERVDWHIKKGNEVFEHYFGFTPAGCWPSEGSVSEQTVEVLSQNGFKWLASGETVLRNSLNNEEQGENNNILHLPYRFQDKSATCFFRDDGLSDLIGFNYATWHADDAVANMIHHLENIAEACKDDERAIVSIILDGENAWEFYPENGYHFLSALYAELSQHPGINLTTYSEYLNKQYLPVTLDRVVAGSWVYGTFSTWIGSQDKNKGWDMLCEAKCAVDTALQQKQFTEQEREQIEIQLAICEGSDWFWWFGDYNPADSVSDFEHLYRLQLSHLYQLIGITAPASLSESFTHGSGHPSAGGTMRRGKEN